MRKALAAAVILSVTAVHCAWAAQESSAPTRTLILRPVPVQGPPIEFDYRFGNTLPPFEKEPALEGKEIARGLIPTFPPTPLIRNITDRELYLKVDHGQDFTTGPVVTYKSQCTDGVHVTFAKVRVFAQRGPLAIPYTVSIHTYQHLYAGRLFVHSGWSGGFELDGRSWRCTIIDNLDGIIDSQDRLYLADVQEPRSIRRYDCPAPQVLCLDGRTFHLEYTFKQVESNVVLEATMTEVQVPMGQLQVDAKGCQSIVLREDSSVAVLGSSDVMFSIPVGQYRVDNCVLAHEPDEWRYPRFAECAQEVAVPSGQTAVLRMGPPLNNVIAITRDRNLLHLKYRLVGTGGESYEYDDPTNPPSFRVYLGPVKVAGGSFGVG